MTLEAEFQKLLARKDATSLTLQPLAPRGCLRIKLMRTKQAKEPQQVEWPAPCDVLDCWRATPPVEALLPV